MKAGNALNNSNINNSNINYSAFDKLSIGQQALITKLADEAKAGIPYSQFDVRFVIDSRNNLFKETNLSNGLSYRFVDKAGRIKAFAGYVGGLKSSATAAPKGQLSQVIAIKGIIK